MLLTCKLDGATTLVIRRRERSELVWKGQTTGAKSYVKTRHSFVPAGLRSVFLRYPALEPGLFIILFQKTNGIVHQRFGSDFCGLHGQHSVEEGEVLPWVSPLQGS